MIRVELEWFSVEEKLPTIPENRYGISVLVTTFDKHCGTGYYAVQSCLYSSTRNRENNKLKLYESSDLENDFMEMWPNADGQDYEWGPVGDPVVFWAYMPDPVTIQHTLGES